MAKTQGWYHGPRVVSRVGPITDQESTDQHHLSLSPPLVTPCHPLSRHGTFSPVSVTISNGPYINLPVKVCGPSSLAMASFILWLAVTFCTSQEGMGKRKKKESLWQWTDLEGNAKYYPMHWSVGFSGPSPLHFTPSSRALEKNVTCGRGGTQSPALMGNLRVYVCRANFSGSLYVQF